MRTLIQHATDITFKGREWMQTHVGNPLPTDYEAFPGKMDHTTCVVFTVGHLSKKRTWEVGDMEEWLQQKSGSFLFIINNAACSLTSSLHRYSLDRR